MEKRERKVSFSAFSDILIHYTVIRRKKQGKRERNFPAFFAFFRRKRQKRYFPMKIRSAETTP